MIFIQVGKNLASQESQVENILLHEHWINSRDRPIWLFLGRYRYIGHSWADTDVSKIFKSCFLLHYRRYDVFYALPFFQNLKNQDL